MAADLSKPPEKPVEIIHYVNEPARQCGNCEHWRGQAYTKGFKDCHNMISGKRKTTASESCRKGFYPSVKRFPLEKRYHQG